jgi:hypothetical protein
MRLTFLFALGLALVLSLPARVSAQATISGTVVDASDAPVPGVLVLVELGLMTHDTVTDTRGRFVLDRLAAGTVRVSASLSGFRPSARR